MCLQFWDISFPKKVANLPYPPLLLFETDIKENESRLVAGSLQKIISKTGRFYRAWAPRHGLTPAGLSVARTPNPPRPSGDQHENVYACFVSKGVSVCMWVSIFVWENIGTLFECVYVQQCHNQLVLFTGCMNAFCIRHVEENKQTNKQVQ